MKKPTNLRRLVAGAAAGLLLAPIIGAATPTDGALVLFTDDFDNAVMDNGVLESTLDYGPATADDDHTFGIGTLDNDALHLGDGGGSIYITAALPKTISLDNEGDFIQMDFEFATSGHAAGNRVLRYGFFAGGSDNDDQALGFFLSGANLPGADSNTRISADTSTTANPFYTSDNPGGGAQVGVFDVVEGANPAWFRIERISATELEASGTHAGVTIPSLVLTIDGNTPTDFDEIWFGIRNRETSFTIDNLEVTYIPEPASLALLGLGGLIMLKRRRG